MGKAIGIDLGTTNSCAAIIENGKPHIITSHGGDTTIPSVFALDKTGQPIIGREAKRQAQLNPMSTIMGAKRLIGRNFHSKTIDKIRQVYTYELVESASSEVMVKVNEQVFTLEQISAAILKHIKSYAERAIGEPVEQAVITVPAYFNDRQRQAVRTAGQMARLKVLRILNEPTAASLAYGMGKNLSSRIAVFDLGGGTFDISVIDIRNRIFEVIATGGDTFLGGVDFDSRVMQYVLEHFLKEHEIDLSWDRVAIQRVRDAAEAAKIQLSSLTETRIHIPYITHGDDGSIDVDISITRQQLESLTTDLVDRTLNTCKRIFREAGTTVEQIDEILLVGGQSRMPLVQKKVAELTGKPPSKGVHPDEAVAIGAAIMAHSLSAQSTADVTLLDVLPMPIGISKVDGTMHVLFQKNQPLPDYKTRTLTTSKDRQRSIMLRIYQGESQQVAENELIGTFVFSGIRSALKGKVQVEVTFHIDSEGILNLTAKDKVTGHTVKSRLKLGKLRKRKAPSSATPGSQPLPKPTVQQGSSAPPSPAALGKPHHAKPDAPASASDTQAATRAASPEPRQAPAKTQPRVPSKPEPGAKAQEQQQGAAAGDEHAPSQISSAAGHASKKPGAWSKVKGWFQKFFS